MLRKQDKDKIKEEASCIPVCAGREGPILIFSIFLPYIHTVSASGFSRGICLSLGCSNENTTRLWGLKQQTRMFSSSGG